MNHKRMAGGYSTVVKDGSNFTEYSGLCQAEMFLAGIKASSSDETVQVWNILHIPA